jgi:hypothetical protein
VASAVKPPQDPVKKLMSLKLDYSQQILEAVVTEDFEALKELSFRLAALAGSGDWSVIRSEEYNQRTAEFLRAVETLRDAPKYRNIDAAAMAYVDMTLTCVHCHKYVRAYRTEPED